MSSGSESTRTELEPPVAGRRLPAPRFGLATLMLFVTAVAIACGIVSAVGPHSAMWIGVLFLAVMAHVFGNAIGTRLRGDAADRRRRTSALDAVERDARRAEPPGPGPAARAPIPPATTTQLWEHTPLGWIIGVATVLGGVWGGVVGWYGFTQWYGEEITTINLCLGTGAAATLGAMWTFAGASLIRVFWKAWKQAAGDT